jgi:hypothetical protein
MDEIAKVDVLNAQNHKSITSLQKQLPVLIRNAPKGLESAQTIGLHRGTIAKNALLANFQWREVESAQTLMSVTPSLAKIAVFAPNQGQASRFHWANINVRVALVIPGKIVK